MFWLGRPGRTFPPASRGLQARPCLSRIASRHVHPFAVTIADVVKEELRCMADVLWRS
jgi:hypothetical protein